MNHRIRSLLALLFGLLLVTACRTALPDRRYPSGPTERAVASTKGVRALDYEIATWYGGRKAACSLTFDDGTLDQFLLAYPELESRDLEATFFVITGLREAGLWNDN